MKIVKMMLFKGPPLSKLEVQNPTREDDTPRWLVFRLELQTPQKDKNKLDIPLNTVYSLLTKKAAVCKVVRNEAPQRKNSTKVAKRKRLTWILPIKMSEKEKGKMIWTDRC